ncbi:metallophosphoesterase [Enterococcus sp. JM4C]|uniref:metallophosphoesterase family protein n=1 Tax=Candidatus Enterococcus huntleyi TaxID=1857217 RepID=UPI00137A9FCD|nr:DNA repair exonuclease [Enterococcus sp. JM4C]KAF1299064.1 metallophosphoesterase [Enterococcus sp. JM4C]
MVKFIHAADLHLDRSFEGLVGMNRNSQMEFLKVNQKVLENLVDIAITEEIDCLILAGDTFHQSRPSLRTQKHFFEQMTRLSEKQIPVFLIFGNHDYYQSDRYWFEFPENVALFTSETVETKQWVTRHGESIAISGFSYTNQWLQRTKVDEFPPRFQVDIHLGIYHGELGKAGNYAPFQLADMTQKGYDYWALGHIHVPTELSLQPPIIYPGTPQGHSQKEERVAGVLLVEIQQGEVIKKAVPIAEVAWITKEVSLKNCRTSQEALAQMAQTDQIGHSVESTDQGLQSNQRALIQLKLKDFEQLGTDFQTSIENHEVVQYLLDKTQQRMSDSYPNASLVWSIELVHQSDERKIKVETSRELANQLFSVYHDPEQFQQILSEIYSHPIAHRLVAESKEFQQEVLQKAQQQIDADFTMGGSEI